MDMQGYTRVYMGIQGYSLEFIGIQGYIIFGYVGDYMVP